MIEPDPTQAAIDDDELAEPIDLLAIAGPSVIRRFAPFMVAAAVIGALGWLLGRSAATR
jgi:hypothetical protein